MEEKNGWMDGWIGWEAGLMTDIQTYISVNMWTGV